MSVEIILLILWIVIMSLFAYYGQVEFFGQIKIQNPILRIAIVLITFPIVGIILVCIGAIFAYPLIEFFNLFN